MKILLSILSLFIAVVSVAAQGEANNWFFGNYCGMTFNTPDKSPKFLIGSQMKTDEGCASISDANGELLFYTDGINVWNSGHVPMPNGEKLFGNPSSTQSAVIVKKPFSDNLYYIFTVDRQGKYHGLCYSIVDMNEASSQGDVISKNNSLNKHVSEKITAVKHKDGKSIWIIAHEWGNNKFISYLLTKNGLSKVPVISTVGSFHKDDDMNAGGYMKASSDGRYIAVAIYWDGVFDILHFNNATGELTHPITFKSDDYKYIYGVEFSADVSKLYFTKSHEKSTVFQVDLLAGSDFDIINSVSVVAESESYYVYQALQIAPDKKIYIAKRNKHYLSVIESPNEDANNCGFKEFGFDLKGTICNAGLPTFNQSFLDIFVEIMGVTELCEGDTLRLVSTKYSKAKYQWICPGTAQSDSSVLIVPNIKPEHSGYYKLKLRYGNLEKTDSVYVNVNVKPIALISPSDTACICGGDAVVLSANSPDPDKTLKYLWSTGEKVKTIEVASTGRYSLIVTNENMCSDTAYIQVIDRDLPTVTIFNTGATILCAGKEIELYISKKYERILWSTGEKDTAIRISKPGKYWVSVVDRYGCSANDTIEIKNFDNNYTHLSDVDFGKTILGVGKTLSFEFVNYGIDSIFVTNISLIKNLPEFSLSYTPSLPVWLKTNESIVVNVNLLPNTKSVFTDSISLIVASPCPDEQIFQITGNSAVGDTKIWLPDTTGHIGDTDYIIPLYGKMLDNDTLGLSFTADIAFDAELFLPAANQAAIIKNEVIDGQRKLTIKVENKRIDSQDNLLVGIKGTVLLSSGRQPLLIEDFKWNTSSVNVNTKNGSLLASGVCQPSLSKVLLLSKKKILVYPNPVDAILTIQTLIKGLEINKIEVYDYAGKLIFIFKQPKKIKENTYSIDVSGIAEGKYLFVFFSGSGKLYEHISIVR